MPRQPARPSAALAAEVSRLLALLGRSDFRRENLALLQEAYPLIARLGSKPGPEWDTFLEHRVFPFSQKWDAWPAIDWGLFVPARWDLGAILTGQWGAVPVFPWTTDTELLRAARRVRRRIGKRHRDPDSWQGPAFALAGDEWNPQTRDPATLGMARGRSRPSHGHRGARTRHPRPTASHAPSPREARAVRARGPPRDAPGAARHRGACPEDGAAHAGQVRRVAPSVRGCAGRSAAGRPPERDAIADGSRTLAHAG
jgi:hypothetical protein